MIGTWVYPHSFVHLPSQFGVQGGGTFLGGVEGGGGRDRDGGGVGRKYILDV